MKKMNKFPFLMTSEGKLQSGQSDLKPGYCKIFHEVVKEIGWSIGGAFISFGKAWSERPKAPHQGIRSWIVLVSGYSWKGPIGYRSVAVVSIIIIMMR